MTQYNRLNKLISNQYQMLSQQGFSLIELMIALVIGLLLVAGATTVWISSKTSFSIQSDLAETQEAGRFAINWLQNEFREVGYLGCANSNDSEYLNSRVTNIEVPSTLKDLGNLIEGREKGASTWQATTTNWLPGGQSHLDEIITALNGTSQIENGTDAFTLRGLEFDGFGVVTTLTPASTSVILESSPGLKANQIVAVVGCTGGTVFQVASDTTNSSVSINLSDTISRILDGESLDNSDPASPVSFSPRQFSTYLHKYKASRYYIRPYHVTNNPQGPSLWRVSLNSSATPVNEEVIPGVDNMQVLYGENTGGSSLPDIYRTAPNVSNWNAITSIKIALLIRSLNAADLSPTSYTVLDETIVVANDKRRRKVFVSEIKLRNRG